MKPLATSDLPCHTYIVMALSLEQLNFCRSLAGEALIVAPLPDDPLAAVTALRKTCTPEEAAAVMELRRVRRRIGTGGKFPPAWADRMLGTDALSQQASSIRLAIHVARRLVAAAGEQPVWDLCCGLGADAIGIAQAGGRVWGYDRSAEAVFCAEHNAKVAGLADRCEFGVADVTELDIPAGAVVHIDPDRRAGPRRTVALADCEPNVEFLNALRQNTRAGAMKLSPALHLDEIADWPDIWTEHLSERGVCKQLVVWWGIPAPSAGRGLATVVEGDPLSGEPTSLPAGAADPARVAEPGPWLLEPDPAVIAAGATDDLAAMLALQGAGAWRLSRTIDWLFADTPAPTVLGRWFRVLAACPGRPKAIAKAIAELGGGIVEIKPRGLKLNTDTLQRQLRGSGERPLAVLWCRLGSKQHAFIAERHPAPH